MNIHQNEDHYLKPMNIHLKYLNVILIQSIPNLKLILMKIMIEIDLDGDEYVII